MAGIAPNSLEYLEVGKFVISRIGEGVGYEIYDTSVVRIQFHLPVLIRVRLKYGLRTRCSTSFLKVLIHYYWDAANGDLIPAKLEPGEVNYVLGRLRGQIGRSLEISLATIEELCDLIETSQVDYILESLI